MLVGALENDQLTGGGGRDVLLGDAGDDQLWGGAGADRLRGGDDADRFVFRSSDFAGDLAGSTDTLVDFARGEGDVIDLSLVDAVMGGADDAFVLIGTAAFSGAAGELRYHQYNNAFGAFTLLEADRNGDGQADMTIRMQGLHDMQAGDFVL